MWLPDEPCNDLPALPPAADVETPAILKTCITASRRLAALHASADLNLNLLFLVQENLLSTPILYLSRAIIRDKASYYSRLNAVTARGEWEPFILYMINSVGETAAWTHRRITLIRRLLDETVTYLRGRLCNIYSRELADLLFMWPYCRISNLVDASIARRQTAASYLDKLAEVGVLDTVRQGKSKLFVNKRLLPFLLTESETYGSVRDIEMFFRRLETGIK